MGTLLVRPKDYKNLFDDFELKKILERIWNDISSCDLFIQEKEPFKYIKEKPAIAEHYIGFLLGRLLAIGILLKPFMPETSAKIFEALKNNSEIKTPLFPRIL